MGTAETYAIEYEFTESDFIEFQVFNRKRRIRQRRSANTPGRTILTALIMMLVIILANFSIVLIGHLDLLAGERQREMSVAFVTLIASSLVIFGFLALIGRGFIRPTLKRRLRDGTFKSFFTKTKVEISPAGINAKSDMTETTMKWLAVIDIAANPDAIYIYLNSIQALVIPRRAFADDGVFDKFLIRLMEYWRSCKEATEPAVAA